MVTQNDEDESAIIDIARISLPMRRASGRPRRERIGSWQQAVLAAARLRAFINRANVTAQGRDRALAYGVAAESLSSLCRDLRDAMPSISLVPAVGHYPLVPGIAL